MTKQLIYLSNVIILCSTPYITPYLIPGYSVVVAILLCSLIVLETKMGIKFRDDLWTKCIKICIGFTILHGILTFVIFFDEYGFIGIKTAFGVSMRYIFVLLSIPLIRHHYKRYHSVLWIINIIIIILSIFLFFLCFLGIDPPNIEFSPDGRPHYFFYIGSSNAIFYFGDRFFIRIAGYCDEPGRLAQILTYLLVLNEFTYKKSAIRILLCFAGLLTFSAAFFITIVPIVIYWIKRKIINSGVILLSLFIGIMVSVISLKSLDSGVRDSVDEAFNSLVINRFVMGSDGKFHGDNRSEAIGEQLECIMSSPLVGVMGKGDDYVVQHHIFTPTIFSTFARYGIFGLLFYFPFIILYKGYRKTAEKWLFIAIGLNFLQRPDLEHMFFLIVITLYYYHNFYGIEAKNLSIVNE